MPPERVHRAGVLARRPTAIRLGYVAVIFLATLSDLRVDLDAISVTDRLRQAGSPSLSGRDIIDGLRNLALFAGWGAIWHLTAPAERERAALLSATLTGLGLSLLVESAQIVSTVRTPSFLDLLTNTAGAFAGALFILGLIRAIRAARGERSFVGVPAFVFAGPYLLAVLLEAFQPLFRQSMIRGSSGGPLERLRLALAMLDGSFSIPWLDLPLFLPAGAFAVAMLVELGTGYSAAMVRAALAGGALLLLAELARGATGQPVEPGAWLTHIVAIVLGAVAARRWLPAATVRLRGPDRPLALLAAYSLALVLWSWRPLLPKIELAAIAEQFTAGHLIPLEALGGRVDLFSVSDVATQFLLYLPVGGLLAVWPLRFTGRWRHALPGVYLAAALELGQVLVAERFFDITDLMVHLAGLAVGWAAIRRAGFRPYGEVLPPPSSRPARGGRQGRRPVAGTGPFRRG